MLKSLSDSRSSAVRIKCKLYLVADKYPNMVHSHLSRQIRQHDFILSTPEARRNLAAFVAHRPNINVAVFHSAKLSAAEVCEAYPPALRERLIPSSDYTELSTCEAVIVCVPTALCWSVATNVKLLC